MIAGPVLSPCSFHSSWSCAALRQGHPASRDQLTDQEQCEAAKRITTRGKILSIDGPKTKRQKRSGFQGRQSGPPQYVYATRRVAVLLPTAFFLTRSTGRARAGVFKEQRSTNSNVSIPKKQMTHKIGLPSTFPSLTHTQANVSCSLDLFWLYVELEPT